MTNISGMDFAALRAMEDRFAAIRKIRGSMNDHRSVAIALEDGRAVAVDSNGHVTVWDADGEVEKEIDV